MNTEARIEADPTLPIVRITRDFRATPAQVMTAHTAPGLFARWIGPGGTEATIDVWDARSGGQWRYVVVCDGEQNAFHGCFHQITDTRIVQTFTWEGLPDDLSLETLYLEDLGDGTTRLRSQMLVDSFEARDAILSSGMQYGVNDGYAKLDAILAES